MTWNQRYLLESHMRHVELVVDAIETAGFTMTELAEWSGGQPRTEFKNANGRKIVIFGHARMEAYSAGGTKLDGCRIGGFDDSNKTSSRVIANAVGATLEPVYNDNGAMMKSRVVKVKVTA